jgi:hypothetical protein
VNTDYVFVHIELVGENFLPHESTVGVTRLAELEMNRIFVADHIAGSEVRPGRLCVIMAGHQSGYFHYALLNVFDLEFLEGFVFQLWISACLVLYVTTEEWRLPGLFPCVECQSNSEKIVNIAVSFDASQEAFSLSILAVPVSLRYRVIWQDPLEHTGSLWPYKTVIE